MIKCINWTIGQTNIGVWWISTDEFPVGDNKWDECLVSNSKITAADLAGDGVVKIITIDTSANVICYNKEGSKLWESVISGTSSPGSRLYDVDKDGTMDIIITTDDGSALFFLQIALVNIYLLLYISKKSS